MHDFNLLRSRIASSLAVRPVLKANRASAFATRIINAYLVKVSLRR